MDKMAGWGNIPFNNSECGFIMKQKFKIDKVGWIKIFKGMGIAGGAAALTYLLEVIPGVDFGASTGVVVGMLSILINMGRKWIISYK